MAALSLTRTAASQSSRRVMVVPTLVCVTGECCTRSDASTGSATASRSCALERSSTTAASSALNVDAWAKRSSARCWTVRPVPVSTASSPIRTSSSSSRAASAGSSTGVGDVVGADEDDVAGVVVAGGRVGRWGGGR